MEKGGVPVVALGSSSSTLAAPKPFVKWVGGKRQILDDIRRHVPKVFERYYEPFLGGGAVFFDLRPAQAFLMDSNERLIRAYRGVREDVDAVIRLLKSFYALHSKDFFLEMRARKDLDGATPAELAAWFIYLNRTGYNGLYRVNSRNIFNVPFGAYKNPTICDETNLRACAATLRGAKLQCCGFEAVLKRARKGDFVYFDPPYVPLTATSNFTDYTREGFGDADQVRLRDVASELKSKGVFVLLSNSSSRRVRDLYKGFDQIRVSARRSVNSRPEGRGPVQELLIK